MTVGSPAERKTSHIFWCLSSTQVEARSQVSVEMVQSKLLSEAKSPCFRSQTSLWSKTRKFLSSSYGTIFTKDIENTSNEKIVGRIADLQNCNLDDSQHGKLVLWYLKAF